MIIAFEWDFKQKIIGGSKRGPSWRASHKDPDSFVLTYKFVET